VVNSETGTFMKSTVRTSSGAQFGRGFDAVFRRIEKRIASVTMIPMGAFLCNTSSAAPALRLLRLFLGQLQDA
jgi:hypothetical protein